MKEEETPHLLINFQAAYGKYMQLCGINRML
jgi:hypothetical protein